MQENILSKKLSLGLNSLSLSLSYSPFADTLIRQKKLRIEMYGSTFWCIEYKKYNQIKYGTVRTTRIVWL